jgi:ADP-heptose:LPS heptosyltransferase
MVHQYLEFAAYLGLQTKAVAWGIGKRGEGPKEIPGEYVVLNIGATKPANRWSVDGFAGLAGMLRRRHNVSCVLTGGPEDVPMAQSIQDASAEGIYNMVGKTSLAELIDVIDGGTAMVTCDTGPMHLAVALGKRVVALFGPSDHHRTGPFRGKVIRARVACAPCGRKACPEPICMEAIRPESVLAVLESCLR